MKRPSRKNAFRTMVVTKIEMVPPDAWNKIFPDVLEGYGFFKTFDESKLDQFVFCYICVYHHKELIGAAPCFMMDYSLDTSINGPLRQATNTVKRVFPALFHLKALVCGIPTNQGHIGIGADPSLVVEAILRRMEMIARKEHVHIIAFKDFARPYDNVFSSLTRHDFIRVNSLPDTELDIDFKDFDGYLKQLSSASRYDLRRKLKKAQGHVTMEVHDALDEVTLVQAYALYRQVVDAHDMGFEILTIDFFRQSARNMPHNVKFFLWRVDGKLAAFLFCLVSDDLLIDYFLGLDYVLALEHHLYFIKFKDVLEWSIRQGIKKYMMGCTGYEPKRRLGFKFVPLSLYVHLRFKPLRPLFKILVCFLKFENFDPELKRWLKERPS